MDWLGQLMVRIASMGPWAPVLFILAYVLATILLAPAFLLTVAAGAVFGFWRGTLLAYVSVLLGSSAVFWLASPLAQSRMLHWLYRDRRVSAVRWGIAGNIVTAWFLTLPAAAIIAALTYWLTVAVL